jgi:hypothetical protein
MTRGPRKPPSSAYEVGRGRPPKATRFKKGQSGNSEGRPKGKRRSAKSTIEQLIELGVVMTVGGKPTRVPLTDFTAAKLAQEANKGSVPALRELNRMTEAYAAIQRRDAVQGSDRTFSFAIVGLYGRALEALQVLNLAAATESGCATLYLPLVAFGVEKLGRPLSDGEQKVLGEACPDFPDWYRKRKVI